MDRPKRLTPKKNDTGEMIGLLPEEEAALRKALMASMQPEKITNKKPSPLPPSKRANVKRGCRRGRGNGKRARGQNDRFDNLDRRCESPVTERDVQFGSSSPFTEPEGMEMIQDEPDNSSDSDSNFSTEEFVRWAPSKRDIMAHNQVHLQESASIASDLSSYNGHEALDFQLTLSQSDSGTPNEAPSPIPSDSSKHCYQSLDSKLTSNSLYHAQKMQHLSHTLTGLGKQGQNDVLKTEDFLSFLCMRNEDEQLPGLLRHFTVTRGKGVTRASSHCRKRKLVDHKKKHSVAKKLVYYKQTHD